MDGDFVPANHLGGLRRDGILESKWFCTEIVHSAIWMHDLELGEIGIKLNSIVYHSYWAQVDYNNATLNVDDRTHQHCLFISVTFDYLTSHPYSPSPTP
jgi:hypothetical protein